MVELRDEFLSEEDLDLRNLSDEELTLPWVSQKPRSPTSSRSDAAGKTTLVRELGPHAARR